MGTKTHKSFPLVIMLSKHFSFLILTHPTNTNSLCPFWSRCEDNQYLLLKKDGRYTLLKIKRIKWEVTHEKCLYKQYSVTNFVVMFSMWRTTLWNVHDLWIFSLNDNDTLLFSCNLTFFIIYQSCCSCISRLYQLLIMLLFIL